MHKQYVVMRTLTLVTQTNTSANWVSMVMSSTGAEGDLTHTHTHTHTHTYTHTHAHTQTLPACTRGPVKYKLVPLMCHKMPPKVINWSVIGGWHVIYMKIICIRHESTFPSIAFYRFYMLKPTQTRAPCSSSSPSATLCFWVAAALCFSTEWNLTRRRIVHAFPFFIYTQKNSINCISI